MSTDPLSSDQMRVVRDETSRRLAIRVLERIERSAKAWEPEARQIWNAPAEDIRRAASYAVVVLRSIGGIVTLPVATSCQKEKP